MDVTSMTKVAINQGAATTVESFALALFFYSVGNCFLKAVEGTTVFKHLQR